MDTTSSSDSPTLRSDEHRERTPASHPTNAHEAPAVVVKDLHVSLSRGRQRTEVLHGIDLEIAPGEIVAVVGESGSGKSVLSLTLMALLPDASSPQVSGSAVVAGTDMAHTSATEQRRTRREHIGAVFQDPMTSLNPTTRVGSQIVEAAGSKDEAIALMRAVGIPQPEERFDAYPHELSGGLRQRVMIAMAMAGDPRLVIADEPTTALDVTVQAQVLRVLRDLRDSLGCSILMITHDLGVAAQIADRIAVMQHGEIVEQGHAEEILDHPRHAYTRRLLRSRLDLSTDRTKTLPVGDERTPVRLIKRKRDRDNRIIELTEVRCDFKVKDRRGRRVPLHALRGVTVDIAAGESLAIVGESGSGKSTLLRTIAGLERRWNGRIEKPDPDQIQMVFQDAGASLTPWLTVHELLTERLRRGALGKGERQQRLTDTLRLMGLPESVLDARPDQLSGGQRQRVALARATIVPPTVLLCDEPTSALDVSLAATVLNLIHQLRQELDMTVIFVTHDLGVARFVSDRVAVMYLGRLVETGPVEDVIGHPRHPYTRTLVDAVPHPGRDLTVVPGEPASPIAPPSGCAFHPRCPVSTPECPTTLAGTQLVALDPGAGASNVHQIACVHREGAVS